ncbi:MAG: hypothetical protein ACW99G_03535 [Candidatus Thorarchaeota archaeon]|jgi:hypothetical protein
MPLSAVITIDTDAINENNRHFESNSLDFSYFKELGEFYDLGYPSTTFVRIDEQTGLRVCDSVERVKKNTEIGWHPHFYHNNKGSFVAERDEAVIVDKMVSWNEKVPKTNLIRIGHTQGGNLIYQTMEELGYTISSTAYPGRMSREEMRHYDWTESTNTPYYPSKFNYQVPGDSHHNVLEVPITTLPITTTYDIMPKRRSISPAMRPELFDQLDLSELDICIVLMHPDELLEGYSDDLYLYGENVINNLKKLEGNVVWQKLSEASLPFQKQ